MERTTMSSSQASVPFLHRRSAHVFITTEDPRYRYEWVCSHCDYPVTPDDDCCPRCQRAIEECPVCSCLRHVRVPCVKPDPQGGRTCPACGVRRVPFGDLVQQQFEGTFCTNLYGCPAGGFLLRTDEFAVLPKDASVCPVCRDPELKPLAVATFAYHVTHCLFCSTIFQSRSTWKEKWGGGPDVLGELGETAGPALDDCVLCGRHDSSVEGAAAAQRSHAGAPPGFGPGERGADEAAPHDGRVTWDARQSDGSVVRLQATTDEYLRMAELGRILALEPTIKTAFPRVFDAWFGSGMDVGGKDDDGPPIHRVVELLLEGTRQVAPRRILQRRISEFLDALAPHFPGREKYSIRPQGKPRPFGARKA